MEWKARAWELFSTTNRSVGEIASMVSRSRKTVSGFLNAHGGYEGVCKKRNEKNAARQREKNRRRMQKIREGERYLEVSKETEGFLLRQGHDIASDILSRERFCRE